MASEMKEEMALHPLTYGDYLVIERHQFGLLATLTPTNPRLLVIFLHFVLSH